MAGSFFKHLANLKEKFSTDYSPVNFINAVAFANAFAEDGVCDGSCRWITKVEITQLGGKEKRDAVCEAELIIARGRKLVQSVSDIAAQVTLLGQLKYDIVMAVIARKNWDDTRTIDEIAANFAKLVCEVRGATEDVHDTAQSSIVPQEAEGPTNAIMYDAEGNSHELGKNTLLNKGYKLKMSVMQYKGDKCIQWLITKIDNDGAVTLNKINIDGSADVVADRVVPLGPFIESFRVCARIEINTTYPKADPRNSGELKNSVAKGKIMEALNQLLVDVPPTIVMLMSAPDKKLLALAPYAVGRFVLVPATLSLDVVFNTKECPRRSIECKCEKLGVRYFLHPGNSKEFVNPFWHMKMVDNVDIANMALEKRTYYSKSPSTNERNKNATIAVDVMVAVNTSPIEMHTEIALYMPNLKEPEKAKKPTTALLDSKEKVMKKARHA